MPPKKNDDDLSSLPPLKAITIWPILALSQKRSEQLITWLINKRLSVQKNLTVDKAVETLKDKGLYVEPKKDPKDAKAVDPTQIQDRTTEVDRLLKEVGVDLIAKNLSVVHSDLIVQWRREKKDKLDGKDTAPKKQAKKEAKKDGKKDSKVEQPPPEQPKVVEKTYKMDADGFVIIVDFPRTADELQKIMDSGQGIPADIILFVEQKVMWEWKEPDLSLLSKGPKSYEQMKKELESPSRVQSSSSVRKQPTNSDQNVENAKQIYKKLTELRSKAAADSPLRRASLRSLRFESNPYRPQESIPLFVDKMLTLAGEFSIDRTGYEEWLKDTKTYPMIKPIQIVEKVPVEQKPEETKKKDGKKEAKKEDKPEFTEKIRQIRYEDQPDNIKSDLKLLKSVNRVKPPSNLQQLLQNVIQTLIPQLQSTPQEIDSIFQNQKAHLSQPICQEPKQLLKISDQSANWDLSLLSISPYLDPGIDYEELANDVKLWSLQCLTKMSRKELKRYYVLKTLETMINQRKQYRQFSFLDRCNTEHYDRDTLKRVLNKQLQSEPQILAFESKLNNLRMLILLHENPPGRILYHNQLLPWKTLPSLENWIRHFKSNPQNLNNKSFLDYSDEMVGDISTKEKVMLPTDNALIKQVGDNVGNKLIVRHQVIKNTCRFGVKPYEGNHEFWALIQDSISMLVTQETEQSVALQSIWIRVPKYIVNLKKGVTFFNTETHSHETKRVIGSKGEVTCYMSDRSIVIMYPSGNTSTYKGGVWTRIVNNCRVRQDTSEQLRRERTTEGNRDITIREDQTITMQQGTIREIIFKDGTRVLTDSQKHSTTVSHPDYPTIRIRLEPHKFTDQNVIGYGSAYALLGATNIFQRSYDGYLFELFSGDFNYYNYHEKIDHDGEIVASQVRIVSFAEGSICKMTENELVMISNQDKINMDKVDAVESWLQLYTTRDNWKEGCYHVNLKEGSIETVDSESNCFKLFIDRPSYTKISVSLNINGDEQAEVPQFGSGYHVEKENYFLPTPKNYIEPALFVIEENGSGYQLLNQSQLKNFVSRTNTDGYVVHEEGYGDVKTLQYTRNLEGAVEHKSVDAFTTPLDKLTDIPRCLRRNPATTVSQSVGNPPKHCIRNITTCKALEDYKPYDELLQRLLEQQKERQHREKVQYAIWTREQMHS